MRAVLRQALRRIPWMQRALVRARRRWNPPPPTLHRRMADIFERKPEGFFVQVGANDGLQGDPLRGLIAGQPNWRGIFIEPVPFLFDRLVNNYGNTGRFIFEKVAIGTERGQRAFYYVSERARTELQGDVPFWHDQLGSFERGPIEETLDGRLTPYIVEEQLECVTLQDVLDKHGVRSLDLLVIDTEGFDFKVLSQLDFHRYRPLAIVFEWAHLSAEELHAAAELLTRFEYEQFQYREDTIAVRKTT